MLMVNCLSLKVKPSSFRAWMSLSVKDFRPVSFCMDRCTAAFATYVSVFPYTSFWVTSMVITCYGVRGSGNAIVM